jgi:toxin YoeB
MKVFFTEQAWKEFNDVKENSELGKSIRATIKEIQRGENLGKAEALKHQLSGYFSRRLDKKNRLIYKIEDDTLKVIQCTGHYGD